MSIEKFEKLVIGRKKKKGKWYYMWIEDGKFHVKEEGDGNPLDADPILEDRFDYKVVTEFGNMLKADVIDNAIYKGYIFSQLDNIKSCCANHFDVTHQFNFIQQCCQSNDIKIEDLASITHIILYG